MTQDKEKYIEPIYRILVENGLKATTMDSVAAALGISKRTLYETFDDKRRMIADVVEAKALQMREEHSGIFENASNVMEAIKKVFDRQGREMERMNPDFLNDLDKYPEIRKRFHEHGNVNHQRKVEEMIRRGQQQGVFRKDLNYTLLFRLIYLQMEAMKRMEGFLPEEITIGEVFKVIGDGMLRTMATPKGLEILVDMGNGEPDTATQR